MGVGMRARACALPAVRAYARAGAQACAAAYVQACSVPSLRLRIGEVCRGMALGRTWACSRAPAQA
eukprot:5714628-Alexandrium_andersonii.AAC.1